MSDRIGITVPERPLLPGLRALLDNATPRPWAVGVKRFQTQPDDAIIAPEVPTDPSLQRLYGGKPVLESCERPDRDLILALVNAYLPALLAFLDADYALREKRRTHHFGHPGEEEILRRDLADAWAALWKLEEAQ